VGFAVAVQVDPDILLIDEVLAVGDADFQQRCLAKMAEFRTLGKSMLIISHDMHTIRAVSDRIVLLDHGTVKGIGSPSELVAQYQTSAVGGRTTARQREWGSGEALITDTALVDEHGNPTTVVGCDRRLRVRIGYQANLVLPTPTFGFSVADASGATLYGSNTDLDGTEIPSIEGKGQLSLEVDVAPLQSGTYLLSFSLHSRDHKLNYHRLEHTLPFHLDRTREFDGIVALQSRWRTDAYPSCANGVEAP